MGGTPQWLSRRCVMAVQWSLGCKHLLHLLLGNMSRWLSSLLETCLSLADLVRRSQQNEKVTQETWEPEGQGGKTEKS